MPLTRSDSSGLQRDALAVARTRAMHACGVLWNAAFPSPRSAALEFELRYRCYLADFGESDRDLIVSTFSKSGTTWMQMILYQLTTSGEMDFDHIFDISPWIYYSALREVPPVRTPEPRILKSHDPYSRFSKGRRGRFVFVVRDGRDVCLSQYHHRRDFKRYDGSFEEHFEEFLHGTDYNWFEHVRGWIENPSKLPITYVRYEDLKNDFDRTVCRVAADCEIPVTNQVLDRVRERCGFDYMKLHERRFAPRNEHFADKSDAPYFVRNPGQFIRRGRVGEGRASLTDAQLDAYRKRFDSSLAGFRLVAEYR